MAQSDSVPLGPGKQHARSSRPFYEPYFAARPPNRFERNRFKVSIRSEADFTACGFRRNNFVHFVHLVLYLTENFVGSKLFSLI